MRIINIIGVSLFYKLYLDFRLYICLLVFINGLFFHSFEKNIYLFYNDVFWTIVLSLRYLYYNRQCLYPMIIVLLISLANNYLFYNLHLYSREICDCFHVCFLHFPVYLKVKNIEEKRRKIK